METFLSELALTLIEKHEKQLADICVVLPNRRAGLFLKKALMDKAANTLLAPDIFSIEDFLTHLTGLKAADNATFLFELYEIHKTIEGESAQPLDQFMKTGQKMLADFNDVDKYLADPKSLFGYLSEAKALEKWNPDGSPLTSAEKDYLTFFRRLLDYYTMINQRLAGRNEAYQGMIYRQAAQNIDSLTEKLKWEKLYFAGFNALTASEEKVINHLRTSGIAEMVRDVDDYYISDSRQEAGFFLRKYLAQEGADKFGKIHHHFKNSPKAIYLHGFPGITGQASLASAILNSIFSNKSEDEKKGVALKTAVIPADEKLLIPLLNTLPENIGKVNVTMGYPLKMTSAYNCMISVFRLYENAERLRFSDAEKSFSFYYRDILGLLQQPLITTVFDSQELLNAIRHSKQVFYTFNQLKSLKNEWQHPKVLDFLEILLSSNHPEPKVLLELLEYGVEQLKSYYFIKIETAATKTAGLLPLEYLHLISVQLKRIRELNNSFNSIHSIRALRETFVLLASAANLPFSGEPLEGLQVLGMLETRNLDFERIIIISANEGTLPSDGKGDSFIPFDIRSVFNLPNHNHHNAVSAYHFYRLLQRASEVHIIYNTEATDLGGGERSRFVQQLVTEYPHYNPLAKIIESVDSPAIPGKYSQRVIQIQKDKIVLKALKTRAESGLSPTSINQFRRCPLQFYFRNIAGIKEADEVEETIEHRTIGSIVHRVLEKLYEPFKSSYLTTQNVNLMKQNADGELATAFDLLYPQGQVKYGRNRLLFEVIRNFIYSFLEFEKSSLVRFENSGSRLKVVDLEKSIEVAGGLLKIEELPGVAINFRGTIDRVDELDGVIRIIDYKTGKVKNESELTIKSWDEFLDGSKKDKSFQVLMYAWLYSRLFLKNNQPVTGGVIGLRSLSKGLMKFGLKEQGMTAYDEIIDASKLEEFESYLKSLFRQMFDSDVPFSQTENIKVCALCDYKNICNR